MVFSVFCVASDDKQAASILRDLRLAGTSDRDISVLRAPAPPGTGPWASALGRWGAHGGARGVSGALVEMGVTPSDARALEHRMLGGEALLCVRTSEPERVRALKRIFRSEGAGEISVAADSMHNALND